MQRSKKNMNKSITGIILIFFIFIASSCSENVPIEEKKEGIELSGERIIRIVFEFPGDDIGSPEHQVVLHKIMTSIRNKEAGEILSSGFGMGTMEIHIKVTGEESIKKIQEIITDNYPDANYSVISNQSLPKH